MSIALRIAHGAIASRSAELRCWIWIAPWCAMPIRIVMYC